MNRKLLGRSPEGRQKKCWIYLVQCVSVDSDIIANTHTW